MPALEKSKIEILLCDFSQGGNERPKAHEPIPRVTTWNGGSQLALTFKVSEFEDNSKIINLLSLEKWYSVTMPVN